MRYVLSLAAQESEVDDVRSGEMPFRAMSQSFSMAKVDADMSRNNDAGSTQKSAAP
jgi:hypothetical protein